MDTFTSPIASALALVVLNFPVFSLGFRGVVMTGLVYFLTLPVGLG